MKKVKDELISLDGSMFTCNRFRDQDDNVSSLYSEFIRHMLKGWSSLRKYQGDYLEDHEVLMRRYIVLDMFEQEVLNSEALNEN